MIFVLLLTLLLGIDVKAAAINLEDPQGLQIPTQALSLTEDQAFEINFSYGKTQGKVLFYPDPTQLFWEESGDHYTFIPLGYALSEPSPIGRALVLTSEPTSGDALDWSRFTWQTKSPLSSFDSIALAQVTAYHNGDVWQFQLNLNHKQSVSAAQVQKQLTNQLLLVNRDHPLPKNYSTKALVPIAKGKGLALGTSMSLMPSARQALYDLLEGAKADGITGFYGTSAYRSVASQQQLYNSFYTRYYKQLGSKSKARTARDKKVAKPGTSEHHTGFGLDLVATGGMTASTFGHTKAFHWLEDHATDYGYIIRYDASKTALTKVMDEPWHLRYVGKPYAALMKENNWCLVEFHMALTQGKVLYAPNETKHTLIYYTKKLPQLTYTTEQPLTYAVSNSGTGGYIVTMVF